ncbi:MAG: DUF2752 domain-containing protein [Flavobacteriaceae bacterium]|nr:DUF2752 domain-containing protein [Flavobacteriaceae bacterium]
MSPSSDWRSWELWEVAIKPKYFLITLAGIIILAMGSLYVFFDPSETAIFPKCPFFWLTGLYCPGCGSQRAIFHILQGDIIGGIQYNILLALLGLILLYQLIYYVLNNRLKRQIRNWLYMPMVTNTILIVVILFWILRNVPVYPFSLLAP